MNYTSKYFQDFSQLCFNIGWNKLEEMVDILSNIQTTKNRLFILGVGGSAGTASHAVNDFRKLAHIETHCPTDNVSELTARINDDGWVNAYQEWLEGFNLSKDDVVLVLSVGGGNVEKDVSANIASAVMYSKKIGCKVLGIVGKLEGVTQTLSDICIIIPEIDPNNITPYTESMHSVILHYFVSHPKLQVQKTKW